MNYRDQLDAELDAGVERERRPRRCEVCGENGTKDRPVGRYNVSPPLDGYPVEEVDAHKTCAEELARGLEE
jgi:hypothetical protein